MAYIYKITNEINGKVYIGKTERGIYKRFLEHKCDCSKRINENRPLYSAMRKYGIDNFSVELLVETSEPEVDEIRLIKEYNSYGKDGYNATLGGDGKKYINIDITELSRKYIDIHSNTMNKLADEYSVCTDTISNLLKIAGVSIKHGGHTTSLAVNQIDKNTGEIIATYRSAHFAGKVVLNNNGSHITQCAKGNRKSAGGFIWEYV